MAGGKVNGEGHDLMADNALALEPIPWKRTEDGPIGIDNWIPFFLPWVMCRSPDPPPSMTKDVHDRKSRIFFFFSII